MTKLFLMILSLIGMGVLSDCRSNRDSESHFRSSEGFGCDRRLWNHVRCLLHSVYHVWNEQTS